MKNKKIIYYIAVVTTLLLLITSFTENPLLALPLYIMIPIGLVKPILLIPVFFIASLSSDLFVAAEGIGFTRVLAIVIILGVTLNYLLAKKQIQFNNKKWIAGCAFIFCATFVSFLVAYEQSITSLLIIGLNLLVFLFIANMDISRKELDLLFSAIFISVFITTIFCAAVILFNPDLLQDRLILQEGLNPNRLGMMLAQLGAFIFAFMFISNKTSVKIICLMAGGLNLILLILTGSRSALAGIIIALFFSLIILFKYRWLISKRFLSISIVSVILLFIFVYAIELNPEVTERLAVEQTIEQESRYSEGGTGRLARIEAQLKYVIPNHLAFGVGRGSFNETISLSPYLSHPGSSHNIIFSTLTQLGLVGLIAYMSFFWIISKETILGLRKNIILIIPLMLIITALANGIGEVMYSERLLWNNFALAALSLVVINNSDNN